MPSSLRLAALVDLIGRGVSLIVRAALKLMLPPGMSCAVVLLLLSSSLGFVPGLTRLFRVLSPAPG